ncbi:MAG: hypothetical protein JNM17_22485 [Archangium sp.]|nr:hypothetical protein [Archangium sp.]
MARLSTVLVLVSLTLVSTGCRRRARPDQAYAQTGVPRTATQTTYTYVGNERERTPGAIPTESLVDEATLYVSPQQTCANVRLRQPMGVDQPLDQLEVHCTADRTKNNGWVTQEQPAGEEAFPFEGAPPMLKVRGPHGGWMQVPIGASQDNVFRVVHRSFQVCCPMGASKVFKLSLQTSAARTEFGWKLNASAFVAPLPQAQPQPQPASQPQTPPISQGDTEEG